MPGLADFLLDQYRRSNISDLNDQLTSGQVPQNQALIKLADITGLPSDLAAANQQRTINQAQGLAPDGSPPQGPTQTGQPIQPQQQTLPQFQQILGQNNGDVAQYTQGRAGQIGMDALKNLPPGTGPLGAALGIVGAQAQAGVPGAVGELSKLPEYLANLQKTQAETNKANADAAKSNAGLPPGYNGGTTAGGTQGAQSFGFPTPQMNTEAYKEAVVTDAAQQKAANANLPYMNNVRSVLKDLEPNLNNYPTGGVGKHLYQDLIGTLDPNGAETVAGANIEKGTSDLATQLGNFQRAPGSRGSDLQLQNIIASKPSISQPVQTNKNIVATLKARLDDYDLSSELQQKYREASPLGITDSNTDLLDNALKQKFPLTSVDPKTGVVTYNPKNVQAIRQAIPDAIANPAKYTSNSTVPVTQPTLSPYQQILLQEAQKRKLAVGGGK